MWQRMEKFYFIQQIYRMMRELPLPSLGNSIQANEKVMQMNFAGSRNITTDRFDYKKLGRATADAIGKSGLKITIDDRELGRIVKGYN